MSYKVLDCEGMQNVLVIFSLVVLAVLVGHDDCADSVLSLASEKIFVIEWVTLQVEDSAFKLGMLAIKYLRLHLLTRRVIPHNHNVSLLSCVVYMETLL